MNPQEPKYRHELKYLSSAAQLPLLESRIKPLMQLDSHVGSAGLYNIRSLYFDDYSNQCYIDNIDGTSPREKFRIRIYNHTPSRITLECKRKDAGKTLKSSSVLSLEQAQLLMAGRPLENFDSLPALQKKLCLQMQGRGLRPVVIVEYERIPYTYKNGNVRVTFDTNLSASSHVEGFFSLDIPKRPVMPAGMHLMEVKFDEYLPDFIYRSLNLGHLQQCSFSKFRLCREYTMIS